MFPVPRMYECMEVALRGVVHYFEQSNWAKGRDPWGSWVQNPNPAVPSARSLTLVHTSALLCVFWTNFNLGS